MQGGVLPIPLAHSVRPSPLKGGLFFFFFFFGPPLRGDGGGAERRCRGVCSLSPWLTVFARPP